MVLYQIDSEVTVETAWVLSLCLKVLSNSLKNSYQPVIPELYQSSFIQCLVFIASKGTEFSQQWFLKDLEVCCDVIKFTEYVFMIVCGFCIHEFLVEVCMMFSVGSVPHAVH